MNRDRFDRIVEVISCWTVACLISWMFFTGLFYTLGLL